MGLETAYLQRVRNFVNKVGVKANAAGEGSSRDVVREPGTPSSSSGEEPSPARRKIPAKKRPCSRLKPGVRVVALPDTDEESDSFSLPCKGEDFLSDSVNGSSEHNSPASANLHSKTDDGKELLEEERNLEDGKSKLEAERKAKQEPERNLVDTRAKQEPETNQEERRANLEPRRPQERRAILEPRKPEERRTKREPSPKPDRVTDRGGSSASSSNPLSALWAREESLHKGQRGILQLCVTNIHHTTTEWAIRSLLNKENKFTFDSFSYYQPKGQCFVKYDTLEGQTYGLSLNQTDFHGQRITVERNQPRLRARKDSYRPQGGRNPVGHGLRSIKSVIEKRRMDIRDDDVSPQNRACGSGQGVPCDWGKSGFPLGDRRDVAKNVMEKGLTTATGNVPQDQEQGAMGRGGDARIQVKEEPNMEGAAFAEHTGHSGHEEPVGHDISSGKNRDEEGQRAGQVKDEPGNEESGADEELGGERTVEEKVQKLKLKLNQLRATDGKLKGTNNAVAEDPSGCTGGMSWHAKKEAKTEQNVDAEVAARGEGSAHDENGEETADKSAAEENTGNEVGREEEGRSGREHSGEGQEQKHKRKWNKWFATDRNLPGEGEVKFGQGKNWGEGYKWKERSRWPEDGGDWEHGARWSATLAEEDTNRRETDQSGGAAASSSGSAPNKTGSWKCETRGSDAKEREQQALIEKMEQLVDYQQEIIRRQDRQLWMEQQRRARSPRGARRPRSRSRGRANKRHQTNTRYKRR